MRKLLILAALFVAAGSLSAQTVGHSLEIDLYGQYAYKDDFGRLGEAPGVGLTFGYLVGPQSQLGVTLVRFSPWLMPSHPVYQFSYGLEYKHFWNPRWADLGGWVPWVSYSLLLDQTFVTDTAGRGMAHHSRAALGTDLVVDDHSHLSFEAGWAMASYASLGTSTTASLSAVHLGAGWRWLF